MQSGGCTRSCSGHVVAVVSTMRFERAGLRLLVSGKVLYSLYATVSLTLTIYDVVVVGMRGCICV